FGRRNSGSFGFHAEGSGNMRTTLIFGALALVLPVICVTGAPGGQAQLLAQAGQPGQQQQPPGYTKEQIEGLTKQNERARNQNSLIKQAMDAMAAKNWQAAVAPLQQLIADGPNNWEFHSAMGDVQFGLGAYDQAIAAYEKGVGLAKSGPDDAKNPN